MKSLIILFLGAIVTLFIGIKRKERSVLPFALIAIALSFLFAINDLRGDLYDWEKNWLFADEQVSMFAFDSNALKFTSILAISSFLMLTLFKDNEQKGGDLLGLMLFALCGAYLLTSYTNLVMLFLGIEILSIPLYVLAGSRKNSLSSNEAALKYFLMGSFTTGIFLLGCALLYGSTGGALNVADFQMPLSLGAHHGFPKMMEVGVILVISGLLFKVSAVPFHFWSPDVYEGSPNRSTAFMAIVVKISAFVALLKFLHLWLPQLYDLWAPMLAVVSASTILLGNITALVQKSFKRTLAYSSIAHAGYLILATLSFTQETLDGFYFYLIAYALSTASLFSILNLFSSEENSEFELFKGLGKKHPAIGFALIVSTLSLAGIPATAGFVGKYYLFSGAFAEFPWLVIIALIGSAISIAYYFKIIKVAYFESEISPSINDIAVPNGIKWSLLLTSIITLIVGLLPYYIKELLNLSS